ncbi:MAG: cysteine desulfurase-like protein [Vicinamibacterales bacterium]
MAHERPFPALDLRDEFPALAAAGDFVFFDNAAGAQVPQRVIDAVTDHLRARNVQRGGPYRHSREVDSIVRTARASVAAFVNASGPDEIAFGLNATSFIRTISLAVGQTLRGRPEIVVSELDHEANVATWLALEAMGATIRWWRVGDDGRLHVEDLDALVSERTRVVACTLASNATGSLVDVTGVAARAHRVGADVFVDAVHFSPHGAIDVRALDCDYLVCSGYKVFSPHMGFAWCRPEAIDRLPTFREAFIPDAMPEKLEAGTFAYESVAGMDAAVRYLEDVGARVLEPAPRSRTATLHETMRAIAAYERTLSSALLDAVEAVSGASVHGVTDRTRLAERVPTVTFTVEGVGAPALAYALAAEDIGVRSGHMYSPRLMARLGLADVGAVRASLVHYNTEDEIARFGERLAGVVAELR